MKKIKSKLLLLIGVAVLLGVGIFIGLNFNGNSTGPVMQEVAADAEDTKESATKEVVPQSESIAIPGFGQVNLVADTHEQMVNFFNPEENTNYFKLTLMLADGTVLWTSDLLEPGKAFYNIQLDQTLAAGEYEEAVLKYECFTMADQSPLNGSEIKLRLVVT